THGRRIPLRVVRFARIDKVGTDGARLYTANTYAPSRKLLRHGPQQGFDRRLGRGVGPTTWHGDTHHRSRHADDGAAVHDLARCFAKYVESAEKIHVHQLAEALCIELTDWCGRHIDTRVHHHTVRCGTEVPPSLLEHVRNLRRVPHIRLIGACTGRSHGCSGMGHIGPGHLETFTQQRVHTRRADPAGSPENDCQSSAHCYSS